MKHITHITPLARALASARSKNPEGKNPTYRLGSFNITLAKDDSYNPGYLYVKDAETYEYLGKVDPNGKYYPSPKRNLDDLDREVLSAAIANPEAVAMELGKQTGTCCCCGRLLTNPLSVELGIGPICREGWFPMPNGAGTPPVYKQEPEPEQEPDILTNLLDISLALDAPVDKQLKDITLLKTPEPKEAAFNEASDEYADGQLEIGDIISAFTRLTFLEKKQCIKALLDNFTGV